MALSLFGRNNDSIFDPFHLDSLFDSHNFRSLSDPAFARDVSAVASTQVDWKETPDAHIFKANLPGLRKEEIKVQVEEGRVLQISGERKKEETQKTDKWHRVERAQGRFMRSFRLPENAKVDEVKASVENGVLTVTVPKVPQPKSAVRTINISG